MQLHIIDIAIIFGYLVLVVVTGFLISRRASRNLDSYFLGGKQMPWYVLGVSNASVMFDITGTMWLVYMAFVYGLKSVWIPWLWPIFNQIFFMIYLSVWIRRSNVLTGAEWIKTRFGSDRGAELSHVSVVVFALVSVIAMIAYAFKGIGKFSAVFLPWDLSPNTYAIIFISITSVYVIAGGMYSVVLTDLIQFCVLTISSFVIGAIAIAKVSPAALDAAVPEGWKSIFFGWRLDLDWSGLIDSVNAKIAADGWSLFTIFFMMMVFKGFLVSAAGPAPNADLQRVLAAKNPKEAGLMSGIVSIVLYFPRYFMIAGITVLALVFLSPQLKAMGPDIDFEMILPYVINNFIPTGLMGFLLAGLLAAFMSTFDSTVNAGAAYLVNDVYKRYINPRAGNKRLVLASYIASLGIVIVGVIFGFIVESIHSVTMWFVSGLWGGYTAANVLKWYWWRLNGFGYFWGMMVGIGAALIFPLAVPSLSPLNAFPFILLLSVIGCGLGSFLTPPEDEEVLKQFYSRVRPWGFWKPVYDKVIKENPNFKKNTNFKRDMCNVMVGITWQTALVVIPIYLVIREKAALWTALVILVITSAILKKNWLDKLEKD